MAPVDLDALARAEVRSEDGRRVRLGSFWEGQRGARILVWLRHFG